MDRRRLLIADASESFRQALQELLGVTYNVRICRDGKTALELMNSFRPDILVLDLMLPELDGISLLSSAAASGMTPMVLATTRFVNDYILDCLSDLGVGYLMLKPCDLRATAARVRDLHERLRPAAVPHSDPRVQISNFLLTLGIPTKLRGYAYLREAVLLMARDREQSVTKELYPAIGAACGSTAVHVERSIRSAINAAWVRRDDRVWQLYFQPGPDGALPRPTNTEFISRLADSLNLSQLPQAL